MLRLINITLGASYNSAIDDAIDIVILFWRHICAHRKSIAF